MNKPTRRQLLTTGFGALGMAALSPALTRLALASIPHDRYYVFAYFPAGWDVLMSMDPRAESFYDDQTLLDGGVMRSLGRTEVDDSALFADTGQVFDSAPFANGMVTTCMQPLLQTFSTGGASALTDVGMCVVRGLNMDTLSHEVGRRRFITGQPPVGQNARGSAIATVLAALANRAEAIPNLAIGTESYNIDQPQWATALGIANVNDMLRALRPADLSIAPEERERVQALLDEFHDCVVARRSPEAEAARAARIGAGSLVENRLDASFDIFANTPQMVALRDRFRISGNNANSVEARAALAAQAIATDTSRVVSYAASPGLDTHFSNWASDQFENQYLGYRALAALVEHLADTPHATSGLSMMEHTTILAFSDFSRSTMINSSGGRDHWLMNSCLLLGKGIHHGIVGASSDEGMAPTEVVIDGVSQYVRPEHIHQALLHDVDLPPDTVDLRVPAYTAVLSAS